MPSPPSGGMPSLPSSESSSGEPSSDPSSPSNDPSSKGKPSSTAARTSPDATDPSRGEQGQGSDDIDFSEEGSGGNSHGEGEEGSPGTGSWSEDPAMTNSESVLVLEGELDASLENYDGMILRERGYILNRRNQKGSEEDLEDPANGEVPYDEDLGDENSSGTAGAKGQADAKGQEGAPNGDASSPSESEASGGGNRPGSQARRSGDYKHGNRSTPPPENIPDGSDDDVVARQIREAAMQEQDPALREKLWEEYRKYKNQTQ